MNERIQKYSFLLEYFSSLEKKAKCQKKKWACNEAGKRKGPWKTSRKLMNLREKPRARASDRRPCQAECTSLNRLLLNPTEWETSQHLTCASAFCLDPREGLWADRSELQRELKVGPLYDGEHARSLFLKSCAWPPVSESPEELAENADCRDPAAGSIRTSRAAPGNTHLEKLTTGRSCHGAWDPPQAHHSLSFTIIQSRTPNSNFLFLRKLWN